jgi:hypothetical protein
MEKGQKQILLHAAQMSIDRAEELLKQNKLYSAFFCAAEAACAYQQAGERKKCEKVSKFWYKVMDQIASNESAQLIGVDVNEDNLESLLEGCTLFKQVNDLCRKQRHPYYPQALAYIKREVKKKYDLI